MTGASVVTGGLVGGYVTGDPVLPSITGGGDWGDLGNAIRLWVITATGLASNKVIWSEQDGPRPTAPFCEVKLGVLDPLGAVDAYEETYDPEGDPGEEVTQTVRGQREFEAVVRMYTQSAIGNDCARAALGRAQTALGLPSVREIFHDAGLTCFDRGQVRPIPAVLDTRWEGRAELVVSFYVEEDASTRTTYVQAVEVTNQEPDPDEVFTVGEPAEG